MRWYVGTDEDSCVNTPIERIAGGGYTITLDGEPTSNVFAFDTDRGWVAHYCTEPHLTGEEGKHVIPGTSAVCILVSHGEVRLIDPNGVDLTDRLPEHDGGRYPAHPRVA